MRNRKKYSITTTCAVTFCDYGMAWMSQHQTLAYGVQPQDIQDYKTFYVSMIYTLLDNWTRCCS